MAKKEYMYGRPHHEKYPYKERIGKIFDEYREKINKLSSDYKINNLLVDLRNEACHVIDEIYQQLSIQLKHNVSIEPTNRKIIYNTLMPKGQGCQVCDEKRAVDRCHIIPREKGGDIDVANILYLCPTHHHLFDHHELSDEEFKKIFVEGKATDSIKYFNEVYIPAYNEKKNRKEGRHEQ